MFLARSRGTDRALDSPKRTVSLSSTPCTLKPSVKAKLLALPILAEVEFSLLKPVPVSPRASGTYIHSLAESTCIHSL